MNKLTKAVFKIYFAILLAIMGLQILLATLAKALPLILEYAVVAVIIAAIITVISRRPRHPRTPPNSPQWT